MSPYESIYKVYKKHRPEVDFPKLLGFYMQTGFVFATPDFFCMGKVAEKEEGVYGWLIEAAAGDTHKMWSILPFPLPWIAFTRLTNPSMELTWVEIDRLRRLSQPNDPPI